MKRETRPIYVKPRWPGFLAPASRIDEEIIGALPKEVEFEITIKRKRSLPQLRAYWAGLTDLVRATHAYPTPEHMHEALKFHLGYVTPIKKLDGSTMFIPDSAAFDAMDAAQFKGFLDDAQKVCLEIWGIDIMKGAEK